MEKIRLQKYFTDCGVLSRRAAEDEIKAGKVKVNGICAELGDKIDPENDIVEYDFDTSITNPIDYKRILENWNLLNTIASTFGMFFEGDSEKYTSLYDLLFRLNTPIEPLSPTYKISEKYFNYILKVFRKKERFLDRFELYSE